MKTCCICHREFEGPGNNPDPFPPEPGNDSCCDRCNAEFVIPERIRELKRLKGL